ncbi:MAG: aryl-sulfate sulfotransferase [Candidatus Sulfotelmatobacter sp.]
MRRSRLGFYLGVTCILPMMASFGCGTGSVTSPAPVTTIAATANPLVAEYTITPNGANATAWVEFGADTTYGRQTSSTTPTMGMRDPLTVLVAGMRPNTTYHMRAHLDAANGESWVGPDETFKTGAIPASAGTLPGIVVTRPTPGLTPSSGVEVFNLVGTNKMLTALVTDIEGNIIWYYSPGNGASPTPMKLMSNGHFIMNVGDLREIDLAGNIVRSITPAAINQSLQANGYSFTISFFHHDVIVLPNGHWITLANTSKDFTNLPGYPGVTDVLGDALIDIDLNGNVAWAWSGFDHLDVNRHLMGLPDWTHSNAIIYAPDGNLLLSMRHQSWILKIDYADGAGAGDILWKLGYQGDFALAGGDDSNWFFAQHYPNLESTNGSVMTLAIVDNGDLRINANDVPCTTTCYTRATVFQVDEATNLATLLWQDLPGFYSFWGGSIGLLGNGDMEFDLTTVASTPASQVMEVTYPDSPQTVWQLNLSGENAYRAFRIPSLYPGVSWQK